jgi:hypothetical protein
MAMGLLHNVCDVPDVPLMLVARSDHLQRVRGKTYKDVPAESGALVAVRHCQQPTRHFVAFSLQFNFSSSTGSDEACTVAGGSRL